MPPSSRGPWGREQVYLEVGRENSNPGHVPHLESRAVCCGRGEAEPLSWIAMRDEGASSGVPASSLCPKRPRGPMCPGTEMLSSAGRRWSVAPETRQSCSRMSAPGGRHRRLEPRTHGGVDNTLGSQVGPGSMDKPHETRKPGGISRTPDLMPCLPTRRPQTPACLSNQREGRREEIRKVKHFLKTLSYHQHGRIKSKGTMIFLTRSVMSAPCRSAL